MATQVRHFSFNKSTSTSTPFTQTISVPGLTETPKVIIFFASTVSNMSDGYRASMGFVDCTVSPRVHRSVGWSSQDAASTTNSARVDSDQYCYRAIGDGGAEHVSIKVTGTSTSGFTITYDANTSSSDYPIHGIVITGTDITNVKVGTITVPTATGSQDITELGWTPDMLFFLTAGTGTSSTINNPVTGARMGFGAASSNAKRASSTVASRNNVATSDTARKNSTTKCISLLNVASDTTALSLEADLEQKLSNGFRLNYSVVPSSAFGLFYLAIKGGAWDVQTFNAATSTGNQTVNTSFPTKGLLMWSTGAGNTTINTHNGFGIGAASGTATDRQSAIYVYDTDGVSTTINARTNAGGGGSSNEGIIRQIIASSSGSSSTVTKNATLSALNSSNFVLNYGTANSSAAYIHAIVIGDQSALPPSTITKTTVGKYDKRILVSKETISKYSHGGVVTVGPIQQEYDILGKVRSETIGKYDKRAIVSTTVIGKYHKANVSSQCIIKYDKKAMIRSECVARYDIAESPELNLRRYLKPYGIRIFIMSHDQRETYHIFNSFNIHESTIRVQKCNTNLAIDEAGRFSFLVEDSGHGIDTSEVGEGNAVLIQAGKTLEDLGDGTHNVIFGYITSKTVHREDTGVLKYEFSGSGSAIRFNERLTNFSRSARRKFHDKPDADTDDPDMVAWKLFRDLLTDATQMPNGGPIESQFTMHGVTDIEPKVDSFIATLENELSEQAESMDHIANSTGATWGVDYNPEINDIFLRYATLEPSNIIIKSGSDIENPDDDKFHTAYILGNWQFTDTRDKSAGFANQIYARVGTKSVKANVLTIDDIIDQYTPLAVNDPPADEDAGQQLPENQFAEFGPVIFIRSDLIGPFSDIWTTIANLSRQFNLNRNSVVMKLGTGTDGPGPAIGQPDWVTPWNTMVSAGCRMYGYIDTQNGNKTVSAVQEEIDRWVGTWKPYGIFFENMSIDTTKVAYYQNLAAYAKSKGIVRVTANARTRVPDVFYTDAPDISLFIVHEAAGFLPITNQPDGVDLGHPQELIYGAGPGRRGVFAYGITSGIASDDDLAQWVSNLEFYNTASYFYITDDSTPQPYDTLSGRLLACMFGAEAAAIRILQDNGWIVPGVPVQQDLAMSFIAETQNLGDLALILSKVGNPLPEAGERSNSALVEIVTDRSVIKSDVDPNTGAVTTTTVNMPNYTEPIAYGYIDFSRIQNEYPTVIFLHGIVKRNQDIAVGQRYWVVLYGRGQNEENTIRWHHANSNESTEYLSARRVPATIRRRAAEQRQQWQVFTKTTHPGFALSYFKNTTHMLVAADSDSIERFGLVEADIDLAGIDDDAVSIRTMNAIIEYSAKPKREYSLTCTVPDDLIQPRMLVRIYDDMTLSGQVAGSTAEGTEAEVVSVDMSWDAYSHPMGCYTVDVTAIGHVDFAYAYWLAKYKRGEVSVKFPHITPKPQGPLPDNNAPIVYVYPKGGLYSTALKVTFTTNKSGVIIYYTTNGTDPIIQGAGGPGSENNTKMYLVGSSAPITINETTTLKFKGVDTEGRESTVYTETYTLKTSTQAGGSKIMFMPYWQGPTASEINNVFWVYMNSTLDYVTYHKRTTENYELSYQNGALGTPSREQEAEFEGYDEMVSNIAAAKAAGFEIIGYNIEGDDRYPSKDKKDVVGYCKKFAEYVRKQGLKVKFNPSPEYTEQYGSRIVQYCDFYNIQCQHVQGNNDKFRQWVRDRVQSIRANNVNAVITITLSADTDQHESAPGMNRLDTLKNRWAYAKDYVDGIRIFYKTTNELNTIVSPFMNWFISSGRAV